MSEPLLELYAMAAEAFFAEIADTSDHTATTFIER